MQFKAFFIFMLLISSSCNNRADSAEIKKHPSNPTVAAYLEDNPYPFIKDIPLPEGFMRKACDSNSFEAFLKNTGLKKDKAVHLYNGQNKLNQSAQFAVLNISLGDKDLQQCADAVMRLRAEFLFTQKEFGRIIFYDNNNAAYKFMPPYSRDNFMAYLNRVFGMCGTASLSKQLNEVAGFSNIQPGDVLIRGGFPGHAAIVVDMAVNEAGEKIYLLAQGYMPAQDIHILNNPMNENLSPWYEAKGDGLVQTPEYLFYRTELKRW